MNRRSAQRAIAVGIDLGTTHSLVATVRNGMRRCLPDDEGRALLPSIVRYLRDGGRSGLRRDGRAGHDAANTIVSVKRLMGRGLADVAGHAAPALRLRRRARHVAAAHARGVKSPVEVSAEILRALRLRAEDVLDGEVDGAVITVPAYFDDAQRQATKDAASWPA